MTPTTFCGTHIRQQAQMMCCQREPVVCEAPRLVTLVPFTEWAPAPLIDWEARCRAAEALLAVAFSRNLIPSCSTCDAPATFSGRYRHACDAHREEEQRKHFMHEEPHAPAVRAWLTLRGEK